MFDIVLGSIEMRYGEFEVEIDPLPSFEYPERSSSISTVLNDGRWTVAIASDVDTWEDVFYETCHESVHLLYPLKNARAPETIVSALEEGVAVKFAEAMYKEYIWGYREVMAKNSPLMDHNSQYFKVFTETVKIPDDVLKTIRQTFGKFSAIDDLDRWMQFVNPYVDEVEARVLLNRFVYPPMRDTTRA